MTKHHSLSHAEAVARLIAEGWIVEEAVGFSNYIGPFWRRVSEGGDIVFGFLTDERHHNTRNVLQGGALMAFADRAIGYGARHYAGVARIATVQFDINFIDAVQIGELVEARPEVVRATKSLLFMRCTFTVGGRMVATAQGVWKVLRPA